MHTVGDGYRDMVSLIINVPFAVIITIPAGGHVQPREEPTHLNAERSSKQAQETCYLN